MGMWIFLCQMIQSFKAVPRMFWNQGGQDQKDTILAIEELPFMASIERQENQIDHFALLSK